MATINNIKGTSFQSFLIGKKGVTIYQGSITPVNQTISPKNGDIYFQSGLGNSDQSIWQYSNSSWIEYQKTNNNLKELSSLSITPNIILGSDNSSNIALLSPQNIKDLLGLKSSAFVDTGTVSGSIPVLDSDGKIPLSTLPSIAITDVYSVNTIEDRDALQAHEGDIAIVTQDSTSYIYDGSKWNAIGSAGSVTGIIGADGKAKTGVVHLDTSDILTGTLETTRGGTGLNSYDDGDILIGKNNSLLALKKPSEDSFLKTTNGEISWSTVSSDEITFTSSILKSSNVHDAIEETVQHSPTIYKNPIDPTVSQDNTQNFKEGDIWINTVSSTIFQAVSTETNKSYWKKIGNTVNPKNTIFIAESGSDDTGDGSANFPFKTISKSLEIVQENQTIILFPGSYDGQDITVSSIGFQGFLGNVKIGGNIAISGNDIKFSNIDFGELSGQPSSITINSSSEIIFMGCQIDPSTSVTFSGNIGAGCMMDNCIVLNDITVSSTSKNPIMLSNLTGPNITVSSGICILNDSFVGKLNHIGGIFNINSVQSTKDSSGESLVSTASNTDFLIVTNSRFNQLDGTYGTVSIGGTKYIFDNCVYDPKTVLPEENRIYGTLTTDIGNTVSYQNISGGNIEKLFESLDSKLSNISTIAKTTFKSLDDVTAYETNDANKTLKINDQGTGVEYGPILGTVSTKNIEDFATSAQGLLANTAVQPSSLSKVATSGKYDDLTGSPILSTVAISGKYDDLTNKPVLSTVSSTGQYDDLLSKPVLGTASTKNIEDFATSSQGALADSAVQPSSLSKVATSGKYDDLLDSPALSPVAISGSFTSLKDCPNTMSSDDIGKVLAVSNTGNSIEFIQLSNVAKSGSYLDLKDTPVLGSMASKESSDFATSAQGLLANTAVQPSSLSKVATSGNYGDLKNIPNFDDDSQDISVKSFKSDNSSILSDGTGNLNIGGILSVGSLILPSMTFTNLPSVPKIGETILVTNGRKPGEDENSGTGVLCIFDGNIWMDISSGTSVLI